MTATQSQINAFNNLVQSGNYTAAATLAASAGYTPAEVSTYINASGLLGAGVTVTESAVASVATISGSDYTSSGWSAPPPAPIDTGSTVERRTSNGNISGSIIQDSAIGQLGAALAAAGMSSADIISTAEADPQLMKMFTDTVAASYGLPSGATIASTQFITTANGATSEERLEFARALTGNSSAQYGDFVLTERTETVWVQGGSWADTSTTSRIDTIVSTTRNFINEINIAKMRRKDVLIHIENMKPFTSMKAFLDVVDISSAVTACTEIKVTNVNGTFLGAMDISVSSDNMDVRSKNNSVFEFGEIITSTNGKKAIVVAFKTRLNSSNVSETILYVVNETGTMTGTVTGNMSAATATVSTQSTPSSLVTDSLGNFYAVFKIPSGTYDTGTKPITVTDNTDGDISKAKTFAIADFYATGVQKNYEDINKVSSQVVTSGGRQWVASSRAMQVGTGVFDMIAIDPLAQTFTLPATHANGAFIHSIDLYFHTKSDTLPVTVEIVNTENGYPTRNVIATATINSDKITASATSLIATRFSFFRLVYLEPNVEYAIRVLSNSNKYKVWVSSMGSKDITSNALITKQPSTGSLFMSQNSSTWTADQLRDLTFTMNYAEFDTTKPGIVDVYPIETEEYLMANPFKTFNGSTKVRVYHLNHNLLAGHYVTFSGSADSRFNASFAVSSVTNSDSYIIELGSASTVNAFVGGNLVKVKVQARLDAFTLNTDFYAPSATMLQPQFKAADEMNSIAASFSSLTLGTIIALDNPVYAMSKENETKHLNQAKSFTSRFILGSSNPHLSPVISMSNIGAVSISNRAMPNDISKLVTEDQVNIITATTISFNGTTNSISSSGGDFSKFVVGKTIVVSGSTSNNGTFKILQADTVNRVLVVNGTITTEAAGDTVTIKQYDMAVDSIVPKGDTTEAVYVLKQINLKNDSTGIHIIVDSLIPDESSVKIYYRAAAADAASISSKTWNQINASVVKGSSMVEREFSVTGLEDFTTFQIKIVMETTKTTKVPMFKNLRIIATA
jgi:hypothetical protein